MNLFLLIILSALSLSPPAHSSEDIQYRLQQKKITLPVNASCGLKEVSLLEFDHFGYKSLGDQFRNKQIGFVVETTSPECIREYGIVQFIKGCVFRDTFDLKTIKRVDRQFSMIRQFHGKTINFSHIDFETDQTEGHDALYSANNNLTQPDRLGFSQVPKSNFTFSTKPSGYMHDLNIIDNSSQYDLLQYTHKPVQTLFISDFPAMSSIFGSTSNSQITVDASSLSFKTCVYHLKDVPLDHDPALFDSPEAQGGPIVCFDWNSIYDFSPITGKIESLETDADLQLTCPARITYQVQ